MHAVSPPPTSQPSHGHGARPPQAGWAGCRSPSPGHHCLFPAGALECLPSAADMRGCWIEGDGMRSLAVRTMFVNRHLLRTHPV